MKEFGLQIYSIRDWFTDEEKTEAAFKKMREFGYTYAQTAGTYSYIDVQKFKALADKYGISFCGTHYDFGLIENDIEGTVNYHRVLGTENIGIGGMPSQAYESKESLFAFIDKFNALAKIYHEKGFRLTYHNHTREFMRVDGEKTYFDYLAEKLHPEYTSFVVDVGWAHIGGMDVRALLEKLKGRVDIVHLKDCHPVNVQLSDGTKMTVLQRIEVGEGNINFKDIIKCAENVGAKYFVVEDEVYSTGKSIDSVRISAENIKKKFLEN